VRNFVLAFTLACAAACTFVAGAESRETAKESAGPYDSFPLWKDVPGKSFATLGDGKLPNGTRWAAYVSRFGPGRKARRNPCVTVASITRKGIYGKAGGCGPLAPTTREPPLYVSVSSSYRTKQGGPAFGETVMALSFANSVTRVELLTYSGEQLSLPTKPLSDRQRQKTQLPASRYVAMGLQRDVCVATVIGYDATGGVLFESDTDLCP
jgi:hypothetical protein